MVIELEEGNNNISKISVEEKVIGVTTVEEKKLYFSQQDSRLQVFYSFSQTPKPLSSKTFCTMVTESSMGLILHQSLSGTRMSSQTE